MRQKRPVWTRFSRFFLRLVRTAWASISLLGMCFAEQDGEKSNIRVTRLVSPDGLREAHGLYVIGADGTVDAKIVVSAADGTGRRALDLTLEAAADVYWFGNDRLAYSVDTPRAG